MSDDDDEGRVVWPIPDDGISYLDAATTVLEISEAELCLSTYAENGNDLNGNLAVILASDGSPGCFFYRALKEALQEELDEPADFDIHDEAYSLDQWPESWSDEQKVARERSERLVIRLLRAYADWEANEATWTLDELRARPLPATPP